MSSFSIGQEGLESEEVQGKVAKALTAITVGENVRKLCDIIFSA